MTAVLNSLFGSLSPLWEMSLTAAYVTAVVALLRLVLKKRAPRQMLCLLWLVVFARLLIPVSLESPLSIVPDALPRQEQRAGLPNQPSRAENPVTPTVPVQNPAQEQSPGTAANPVISSPNPPALTLPGDTAPAVPAPETPASFPWQALIAGVWLAGALAMGGYGLISYLRLRRRLFNAIRAEDGAWEHPAVGSPFILGLVRPRIYLPAGLRGMPRQFILCHERAHLRRLDHIVKPVCWAALALHWFNPAVWAAFILMSRDIEAACDEAVIRRLGPKVKADYSATLLALATNGRAPAPCPLAFDEGNAKGRIKNVLRYRRPALWVIVVSAIAAVLAAVCLLTDPVAADPPEDTPDPSPGASASQPPEKDGILDPWMREVLDGERMFRRADDDNPNHEYTINQLNAFFYGEPVNMTVKAGRLAVIDLDRDGVNELVVWPEGEDEYLYSVVGLAILRRQGNEVCGSAPGYRSFGDLKADGTFTFSSSADNWGIMTASFLEGRFELSHDNTISWCEGDGGEIGYFVDGLKATREEFYAAVDAQEAKPDPVWYTYENGALSRILPAIPLDDYALSAPVPDFLDEEQQLLYRRAYALYYSLFPCSNDSAHFLPAQGIPEPAEGVERYGITYAPEYGRFNRWDDFERAVLSVFTRDAWDAKNGPHATGGAPVYIGVDNRTYYISYGRGGGDYNGSFPETFRLVERTEDAVEFVMTGYYTNWAELPGETFEEHLARQEQWEYSIDFPMRLVKTEDGWRFDQFYLAVTDDFGTPDLPRIPNPDAPASPEPTPEPTPTPEPEVLSNLGGISLLRTVDGIRLVWSENGQMFPVGPDAPSPNYNPWLEDFDEDGQIEAVFPADGSYPFTIYDFVGNALVGYPLPDMETEVYQAISASSVAAYDPATGGLTMTFPWGEGDSRRYITLHATLPGDFFAGCEELADGRPLRMKVEPGSINGMGVPKGLSYRAKISLTDGTATSPEVGYMWFGIHYSDSGFEIRTPEESDFGTDYPA